MASCTVVAAIVPEGVVPISAAPEDEDKSVTISVMASGIVVELTNPTGVNGSAVVTEADRSANEILFVSSADVSNTIIASSAETDTPDSAVSDGMRLLAM
jgi:hypothetical protein